MGAITIRRLDDAVIAAIKQRAAARGRSMEEEARQALVTAYAVADQDKRRRWAAARLRDLHKGGVLPKSDIDSVELIRQMREERDQQILDTLEDKSAADR